MYVDLVERNALAAANPADPIIAQIDTQIERREFLRFHTWHEFSRTFRPVKGVVITPKAGAGFTQYWQEGADDNSHSRYILSAGVDSSLKFVRNYPNILSTNGLDSSIRGIDRLTASTRLSPIDVGSFTAIDEINSWGVVRQGVYNELLTRRDGGSHPWLTLNTYFDYFMKLNFLYLEEVLISQNLRQVFDLCRTKIGR